VKHVPQRLAGIGLAIAALTIIALAMLILADLERETLLNRETIAAQQVKDSLDRLRIQLTELRASARLGALTGDAESFRNIDRRAVELDSELAYLARRAAAGAPLPTLPSLAPAARLLAAHARSIAPALGARGNESAAALARAAGRTADEAIAALELSDKAVTSHINERTLAQIRLGERLRNYVTSLLVGSIAILAGLFLGYRWVQGRVRDAQQRIEQLAHFDTVTGLPNRALLEDRLEQETTRARRSARGFALLYFDLDGFKTVNDTWGHAAGDRVLALVGERVRKCVRASDTVGRLGGDEFLAILPETTLEGAMGVAEKLRDSLREPFPIGEADAKRGASVGMKKLRDSLRKPYPRGKAEAKLGASVGVSLFPEHGEDADALQRAADAALYRAKREGKDRTIVATAAVPSTEPATDAENAG
jgi:diguanylate cyclase (GGDEF)-like protein